MYEIQTNAKGSRQMSIADEHLETIEKYALFQHLIDSNGIVDETVLDRLKLHVRALIEAGTETNDLVNLCKDVLYHENMKAYGLNQLIVLFTNWLQTQNETSLEEDLNE